MHDYVAFTELFISFLLIKQQKLSTLTHIAIFKIIKDKTHSFSNRYDISANRRIIKGTTYIFSDVL